MNRWLSNACVKMSFAPGDKGAAGEHLPGIQYQYHCCSVYSKMSRDICYLFKYLLEFWILHIFTVTFKLLKGAILNAIVIRTLCVKSFLYNKAITV